MTGKIHVPLIVRAIARAIAAAGGRAMLVGGAVVDSIQGKSPKDWDIEAYGISMDHLERVLEQWGPNTVGKSFGILKLSTSLCDGHDIDVNVPRRDNNTGIGHRDFDIVIDPNMTPKEAALRRDFTINSMFYDMVEEKIVDPYGGVTDLANGVLRATDHTTFIEDPLRVLRAMQLLPRKAKIIDTATMNLCYSMHHTFPSLAKERVLEEFRKLLLKADKPSIGLQFLRDSGWISHFPELELLIGCRQHPEWHPEGDVWIHSLHVVDSAAAVRDQVPEEWREPFMLGAMLHDVGKPATTVTPEMVKADQAPVDRLWTAYGHDRAGEAPAETFLRRITDEKKVIERAVVIVGEHMQPYNLHQGGARISAYRRLHNKIRLDVIGLVSRCDCCGRPDRQIGDPDLEHEVSDSCFARFDEFGEDPIPRKLLGRDLINAGFKPGTRFGVMLGAAYEAQLEDDSLSKDDLLVIARSVQ
jgi:tRNA nucleotidyltransferase (CCA-adding enzyme)